MDPNQTQNIFAGNKEFSVEPGAGKNLSVPCGNSGTRSFDVTKDSMESLLR